MNRNRRNRHSSGQCPVCGACLQVTKQELFEKLNLDEQKVTQEGLTEKDVKNAYKEAAKTHHPDKGGDPTLFQELNEAKEELLDIVREDLDLLDINPIGQALERQKAEDLAQPQPQKRLTRDQLKEVIKSIDNLRRAKRANPKDPCPHCEKRPTR